MTLRQHHWTWSAHWSFAILQAKTIGFQIIILVILWQLLKFLPEIMVKGDQLYIFHTCFHTFQHPSGTWDHLRSEKIWENLRNMDQLISTGFPELHEWVADPNALAKWPIRPHQRWLSYQVSDWTCKAANYHKHRHMNDSKQGDKHDYHVISCKTYAYVCEIRNLCLDKYIISFYDSTNQHIILECCWWFVWRKAKCQNFHPSFYVNYLIFLDARETWKIKMRSNCSEHATCVVQTA